MEKLNDAFGQLGTQARRMRRRSGFLTDVMQVEDRDTNFFKTRAFGKRAPNSRDFDDTSMFSSWAGAGKMYSIKSIRVWHGSRIYGVQVVWNIKDESKVQMPEPLGLFPGAKRSVFNLRSGEYLTVVDGTALDEDGDSEFGADRAGIYSLQFTTNRGHQVSFGTRVGKPFSAKMPDKHVVTLFGSSSDFLNTIGVTFQRVPRYLRDEFYHVVRRDRSIHRSFVVGKKPLGKTQLKFDDMVAVEAMEREGKPFRMTKVHVWMNLSTGLLGIAPSWGSDSLPESALEGDEQKKSEVRASRNMLPDEARHDFELRPGESVLLVSGVYNAEDRRIEAIAITTSLGKYEEFRIKTREPSGEPFVMRPADQASVLGFAGVSGEYGISKLSMLWKYTPDEDYLEQAQLQGDISLSGVKDNGDAGTAPPIRRRASGMIEVTDVNLRNELFELIEMPPSGPNNMYNISKLKTMLDRYPVLLHARESLRNESPLHVSARLGQLEYVKTLLAHGFAPEVLSDEDNMCFHSVFDEPPANLGTANLETKAQIFFTMLDKCDDVESVRTHIFNYANANQDTPLHLAVEKNMVSVVSKMLKYGVDLTGANRDGRTPFHIAASLPNNMGRSVLQVLLEHSGKQANDARDVFNRTPMHLAAKEANDECIRLLLDAKCERVKFDVDERTPLHHAVDVDCDESILPRKKRVLEYLFKEEKRRKMPVLGGIGREFGDFSFVNMYDINGKTPLHLLVQTNNVSLLEHFFHLAKKHKHQVLDVNCGDKHGNTPLHITVRKDPHPSHHTDDKHSATNHERKLDIVIRLLSAMAIVDRRNNNGETPLHMIGSFESWRSYQTSTDDAKTVMEKMLFTMCQMLIKNKAGIQVCDKRGRTPLHHACMGGIESIVKVLIRQGAEPNYMDTEKRTPLSYAIIGGHLDVVKFFVEDQHADIEQPDARKNTPLILACEHNPRNNTDIAEFIFSRGADPLRVNADGLSAMSIAARGGDATQGLVNTFFSYQGGIHPFHLAENVAEEEQGGPSENSAQRPLILHLADMGASEKTLSDVLYRFQHGEKMPTADGHRVFMDFALSQKNFEFLMSRDGETALLQVLGSRNKTILGHPSMSVMLDALWRRFARRRFILDTIVHGVLVFCLTWIVFSRGLGSIHTNEQVMRLRRTFGFIILACNGWEIRSESREFLNALRGRQLVNYILSPWNWFDYSQYFLVFVCIPFYFEADLSGSRHLLAILILVVWLRALEYLTAFRVTSTSVRVLVRMCWSLLEFSFLLFVFMVMFGLGIFMMDVHVPGHSSFLGTLWGLFSGLMGDMDFDTIVEADNTILTSFFVMFTLIGPIIVLNLLIATMTTSYESVRQDADNEFLVDRGDAIVKVIPRDSGFTLGRYIVHSSITKRLFPFLNFSREDSASHKWYHKLCIRYLPSATPFKDLIIRSLFYQRHYVMYYTKMLRYDDFDEEKRSWCPSMVVKDQDEFASGNIAVAMSGILSMVEEEAKDQKAQLMRLRSEMNRLQSVTEEKVSYISKRVNKTEHIVRRITKSKFLGGRQLAGTGAKLAKKLPVKSAGKNRDSFDNEMPIFGSISDQAIPDLPQEDSD